MLNLAATLILSQVSISTDPRLSERIRFDSALTPIETFIGIARASSRVSLSIDPSLEYLKIDAFVDDQPLGLTLSKVSEVFSLDWQKDGDGYKLVPNKAAQEQQKAYLVDEENKVIKVVEQEIAVYREIDRLIPRSDKPWGRKTKRFDAWIPQTETALDVLERAKENNETTEKIESLQTKYDALKQISDGSPNLQLARLFGQMTQTEVNELRNGIPFVASNEVKARFQYSIGDIKPNDALPMSHAIRSVVITHIDPESHRIAYKEMTFVENQTAMAAEPSRHFPFDEIAPSLRKKPFAVALKEWDQTDGLNKSLTGSYAPNYDDINGGVSPWFGKRQRLGDHLRWFHRVTDVPIIAQADRFAHPFIRSYRIAKNPGDYMSMLLKACKSYSHKSDDFLLVRDGVFWRKPETEIPEHVLAILEHPNGRKLSVTNYCDFASRISHLQAMALEDSNGFVIRFPRFRFAEAYPVFKFLAGLNEVQYFEAFNIQKSTPFMLLNDEQQKLFTRSVISGITGRGLISKSFLNTLIYSGLSPNILPGMMFETRNVQMKLSTYSSDTVTENGQVIELIPKRTVENQQWFDFTFRCFDEKASVTFLTENIGL